MEDLQDRELNFNVAMTIIGAIWHVRCFYEKCYLHQRTGHKPLTHISKLMVEESLSTIYCKTEN